MTRPAPRSIDQYLSQLRDALKGEAFKAFVFNNPLTQVSSSCARADRTLAARLEQVGVETQGTHPKPES